MPPKRTSSRRNSSPPAKRPKRSKNTEPLEDEVFEDQPKEEPEKESEVENSSDSSSDDEEGSSSESDFEFESLARTRSRRAVAGNRMHQLLEEQKTKVKSMLPMTEEDKEAYKDFVEVDDDKDFEADDQVIKSDSEVDSDFDEEEVDNEPEDAGERELKEEKRSDRTAKSEQQRKKREKLMKELATNLMVEDNIVDDKTHVRYLAEAKEVAIKNKADLLRIEEQLARRREEDLAAFKPIIRERRQDVIRLQRGFTKDGDFVKRLTIPEKNLKDHSPSQVWIDKQHLMPPKPKGFDQMAPEIIGFGF